MWILGQRDGLHTLIQRLEGYLGPEIQDSIRYHSKAFHRYRRPRGASLNDYIIEFERLYSEAVNNGMWMNAITLSTHLLENAMISEQQESWVMQGVAGDYSRYEEIHLALKRVPHGGRNNPKLQYPVS